MKKILKSILAIVLIISIAFSAIIPASALSATDIVEAGLVVVRAVYEAGKNVLNKIFQKSTAMSKYNISSNEWVEFKTQKNAKISLCVNDGKIGDNVVAVLNRYVSGNGGKWIAASFENKLYGSTLYDLESLGVSENPGKFKIEKIMYLNQLCILLKAKRK